MSTTSWTTPPPKTSPTSRGDAGLLYVGPDADGEDLEVITVTTDAGATLVIHAMPRRYRRR